MKIRDLIAYPFLLLSLLCEYTAIVIGSEWTSQLILDSYDIKKKATKIA